MNNDQLKQTGLALIAASEGKPWQWMDSLGVWNESHLEQSYGLRHYLAENYPLRPKPQPAMRAWSKPEDVPLNCWLRFPIAFEHHTFICSVGSPGIWLGGASECITWLDLAGDKAEYSIDRINWKPCTIEA